MPEPEHAAERSRRSLNESSEPRCDTALARLLRTPLNLPATPTEPTCPKLRDLHGLVHDPDLRRRVLHGRTGFMAEESARSVLAGSVDLEEFHSTPSLPTGQATGEVPSILARKGMVA